VNPYRAAAVSLTVSILGILQSDGLADRIKSSVSAQRYVLTICEDPAAFLTAAQGQDPSPDCLLLENNPALDSLLQDLHQSAILLPSLILTAPNPSPQPAPHQHYHPAEVYLSTTAIDQLETSIDAAIKQFLQLSPSDPLLSSPEFPSGSCCSLLPPKTLLQDQQRRLADKLRERLGYLGIYYKRDPQLFLRNLPPEDVAQVLSNLKHQYQAIVLTYFAESTGSNTTIDEFVNTVFFSDISVTKIVEIHMELMDEFSKQLKLEGRSEEILVDYRLTLLDIIAHLCEMYRRSIPRES
jgi:circadian clock protein KaiA